MIEGLVGLIEVFVTAVSALISAILHLIAVVLESLGFAATELAMKPKPGERRFSVKRLAIAFAPLAFLIIMIPAMFWLASWRAAVNEERRKQTETIVANTADKLADSIGKDGRFVRSDGVETVDAWSRKIVVEYLESELTETLLVRSTGIDGKPRTYDDVVAKRRNVLPITDVVGAAIRRLKDGLTKPDSEN